MNINNQLDTTKAHSSLVSKKSRNQSLIENQKIFHQRSLINKQENLEKQLPLPKSIFFGFSDINELKLLKRNACLMISTLSQKSNTYFCAIPSGLLNSTATHANFDKPSFKISISSNYFNPSIKKVFFQHQNDEINDILEFQEFRKKRFLLFSNPYNFQSSYTLSPTSSFSPPPPPPPIIIPRIDFDGFKTPISSLIEIQSIPKNKLLKIISIIFIAILFILWRCNCSNKNKKI